MNPNLAHLHKCSKIKTHHTNQVSTVFLSLKQNSTALTDLVFTILFLFSHPDNQLLFSVSNSLTDTVTPPPQVDTQLHQFSPILTPNCMTWRHQLCLAALNLILHLNGM